MKDHTANIRRQLGELSELGAKSEAAERRILESAERQLDTITGNLPGLRRRAMLESEAGREYQRLVADRHRLERVIAQARANLSRE